MHEIERTCSGGGLDGWRGTHSNGTGVILRRTVGGLTVRILLVYCTKPVGFVSVNSWPKPSGVTIYPLAFLGCHRRYFHFCQIENVVAVGWNLQTVGPSGKECCKIQLTMIVYEKLDTPIWLRANQVTFITALFVASSHRFLFKLKWLLFAIIYAGGRTKLSIVGSILLCCNRAVV